MKFDRLLNEAIDSSVGATGDSKTLDDLLDEITEAESYLESLRSQLDGKVEELCATVSAELKKLLPKVDAKLSRGSVIFSYYSRSVGVRPDIKDGSWKVEAGPGARDRAMVSKFAKEWDDTPIGEWHELVQALAQVFVGNYKTLQGGKVDLPEEPVEDEIPDDAIDKAIDNVGATSPAPPTGRAVEKKGTTKPGTETYA